MCCALAVNLKVPIMQSVDDWWLPSFLKGLVNMACRYVLAGMLCLLDAVLE